MVGGILADAAALVGRARPLQPLRVPPRPQLCGETDSSQACFSDASRPTLPAIQP